jgi:signal transduction histidine kinase
MLSARRAEHQINHQLEQIIAVVQGSAFPLTHSTLQQMKGLSGAEFVLTDHMGREIATSRLSLPRGALDYSPATADRGLGTPLTIGDNRYFHRAVRVLRAAEGGAPILHVLYPESTSKAARRAAIYAPLFAGVFGTLLAMVLSAVLSRRIARPTVELARRMSQLSEHGYPQMQIPDRNDEIRDLVLSANGLSSRIAELSATIRRTERLAILGQLGGGMAHQLRNAAAGARLAVQLHDRACAGDDGECLHNALRQLDLIEEQVSCLLSLGTSAKAESKEFDLNQLLLDVAQLIRPTCRHRGIELQLNTRSTPLAVRGDRSGLRNAILNLALNAIEAARSRVRLELILDEISKCIRVHCADDGPGIVCEIAERLFEPFVTTKPEGIGLGLTVSKQVAASHGGRLTYDRCGEETVFVLELPLEP